MIYLIEESGLFATPRDSLLTKELSEDNQRHLKALRPDLGECVAFLNLKGMAYVYEVTSINPVTLSLKNKIDKKPTAFSVHLFLAPPSDSALEQAVEQATEIGFSHIHFVRSDHVQVPKGKSLPFARLRRIVNASCKQCARFWAPEIDENFYTLSEALAFSRSMRAVVADEGTASARLGTLNVKALEKSSADLAIYIGPEGGWSDSERSELKQAAIPMSLGPNILRVPTAVVSAYMLLMKELDL